MAKTIETGHVVIEDDAEENISESLLSTQQNNSEVSPAIAPEVATEAATEKTASQETVTREDNTSLTLTKAASFLSNGILFKHGVAQPVGDEAFRKKLIDTGLFKV